MQMICVVIISLFLRLCRQPSKICRRSLCRQIFETFLLATFEPRTVGVINVKQVAIRIIITTAILTGFLMRKAFCSKLNALFAFEGADYVKNLNESLAASQITTLAPVGHIPYALVMIHY